MVAMQKMTATWTGFTGAPGTTTVFWNGGTLVNPSQLKTFFDAYAAYIPNTVSILVNASGQYVESTTGLVTGTWSMSGPAPTIGTATGGVLLTAQGAQVRLETGQFRRGKHIRGRFYLIPCYSSILQSTGVISTTAKSALDAALQTMNSNTGGMFGMWHRPLKDYSVKPPLLKEPGEWISVPSATVNTKVAVLTSRRD